MSLAYCCVGGGHVALFKQFSHVMENPQLVEVRRQDLFPFEAAAEEGPTAGLAPLTPPQRPPPRKPVELVDLAERESPAEEKEQQRANMEAALCMVTREALGQLTALQLCSICRTLGAAHGYVPIYLHTMHTKRFFNELDASIWQCSSQMPSV
jgi:hypothetical protein